MAEAVETAQQAQPKVVSVGAPQVVNRNANQVNPPKDLPAEGGDKGQSNADTSGPNQQASANSTTSASAPPAPTEDQMKLFFESQGLEWKGMDDIKARFTKKEELAAPTEEQKAAAKKARDNRKLQIYLDGGGTVEQYAAISSVANKDLKELSQQEALREFKAAGFSEDESKQLVKERYYQLNQEEIDRLDDETDKEFAKRKAAYFTTKLENKASYLQNDAKKILQGLDTAVDAEETQRQKEVAISSKVEDHFSKMPRELTFDLGKVDDQEISPIKYKVEDADIAGVLDTLKDPEKRKKFLYTEDGSLNIEAISDALVKAAILTSAVKVATLEGGSRQTKFFEKTFPLRNPHAIGTGGAVNGGSSSKKAGSLVSMGKPEVVRANNSN